MKRNMVILLLSSAILGVVGCATLTKGSKQLVTVNSNVVGAEVYVDGNRIGETPFTGEIKKGGKLLELRKSGYKTYQMALTTNLEGMFWGNIITGGTLGSMTDFASGAAWAYSPASFQVEMLKDGFTLNKFEKTVNLKKFAMLNMSDISNDLANGNGQHLNALLQLAGLDANTENIQIVRDLFKSSRGNQVAFGEAMVTVGQL